jgi:DNA polymerase III sliding clamp (beta) subunit (PCNA family)
MATVTKSSKILRASKMLFKGQPKHYRRKMQFQGRTFVASDMERQLKLWFADEVSNGEYTNLEELELYDCELELGVSDESNQDATGFEAGRLADAIQFCSAACEDWSTRYLLSCVLFDPEGWLVATDGRRLHRRMVGKIATNPNGCTVRASDCDVVVGLIKLFGDDYVHIWFDEKRAYFVGLHWMFSCELSFGRFPNWRHVITDESRPLVAEFDKRELRQVCEIEKRNAALRSKLAKGKLTTSKDRKDFTDEIPGVLIANVRYDARFVLDALDGFGGSKIGFYRSDESSALFFANAGFGCSGCMMGLS